ncbi:hypothetical protein D7231_32955 [Streptomyces klenkii]|uniref:DUF4397 domain-containing protein n=2 Tax=Streptomyces TaxID=1883 RepID=A0A3B0AKF0_9ACTN|nr:hypothetical protein D7231_32955 [Streptomyces klenkii]
MQIMTTSSVPRRSVLRILTVAAALAGCATPALDAMAPGAAAFAAAPQTYSLTIRHLDRGGSSTGAYDTTVTGISGPGAGETVHPHDASGTTTVRLPKGRYLLDSYLTTGNTADGTDWVVQPRLDLDRDTTVTVDARTTAPVDVRPPDRSAAFLHGMMVTEVKHGGTTRLINRMIATPSLRVAHLGPDAEPGAVKQWYDAYWTTKSADYALGYVFTGPRALTGLTRHPSAKDLATVQVRGGARPGTTGSATVDLEPSAGPTAGLTGRLTVPGTATYFVTPERGTWDITYWAPTTPGAPAKRYNADNITVRAGTTTTRTFDNAPISPARTGQPFTAPAPAGTSTRRT